MANNEKMDSDEQVKPILFNLDERDLIVNLMSIDLETKKRFRLALLKDNGVVVDMNAYDLDLLLGDIAAVANHTNNQKLKKKLQNLFDRISKILEAEYPLEK